MTSGMKRLKGKTVFIANLILDIPDSQAANKPTNAHQLHGWMQRNYGATIKLLRTGPATGSGRILHDWQSPSCLLRTVIPLGKNGLIYTELLTTPLTAPIWLQSRGGLLICTHTTVNEQQQAA